MGRVLIKCTKAVGFPGRSKSSLPLTYHAFRLLLPLQAKPDVHACIDRAVPYRADQPTIDVPFVLQQGCTCRSWHETFFP